MKNNPESGEFCCLHICLFNNGKAIHFRTTLTPMRLLFLLFITLTITDRRDEKMLSKMMRPKKRSMTECNAQISGNFRNTSLYSRLYAGQASFILVVELFSLVHL